jgi:hypothetical protein
VKWKIDLNRFLPENEDQNVLWLHKVGYATIKSAQEDMWNHKKQKYLLGR